MLIECKTYRYRGHSEHDAALYRDKEELIEWQSRDPIPRFEFYLEKKGHDIKRIREQIDERVRTRRCRRRWNSPKAVRCQNLKKHLKISTRRRALRFRPAPRPTARANAMEVTYLKAINPALHEEMRRDENVFVMGEDVAELGGAFKATEGLLDAFGEDRVIDTPISEALIIGAGIGAAVLGMRPVVEMQFADFISCAFDQIVNTAATLRYRHGGKAACPLVIRAPSGAGVHGALFHSQNPEAWFTRVPGLKVVAPATPTTRKGC